jgi:hypothetical protein
VQRVSTAVRTPDGEEADPFQVALEYLQYNVHRMAIEVGKGGGMMPTAYVSEVCPRALCG